SIFIYYSGHGWLDETDNSYYLLQHDIKPSKLAASALSAEVFTEAVRQIPAERLLVVIDSCHAAGMATSKEPKEIIREVEKIDTELADEFANFKRVSASKGLVEQLKQGKGRVVFASSRGEEKSWIHPDGLYSIYTYHFLEALQGAANQPGDTEVKVSNVMNHLSKTVPETVRQFYKKEQNPNFDMATEDFAIAQLLGGKGLPDKGAQEEQPQAKERSVHIDRITKQSGKYNTYGENMENVQVGNRTYYNNKHDG
ncbi:MAG: caspase family protein, partial [Okeania sp. SIO2H7]|nr:caspase family protein [Okeania sp. SIO2H7]